MKNIVFITAVLALLTAAGCKQPLDLSMQRNRIFLMGRLLAGKTCDVRVIWRKAPGEADPAAVTADLSRIGGPAAQELAATDNGTWRWSGQVTPEGAGEKLITITAAAADGGRTEVSKRFRVFDTQKAIQIDAGGGNPSLALMADGTVEAWSLETGARQDVPAEVSDITALAASWPQRLALKTDGTVIAWGCEDPAYDFGQCAVPAGLADVVAIAASSTYSLAVRADGAVVAWGNGAYVPDNITDVVTISASYEHAAAVKADGTMVSWPFAYTTDDAVAVSAGSAVTSLKSDGSIVQFPASFDLPRRMSTVRATAVSAGEGAGIALQANGRAVLWYYYGPDLIFHRFWHAVAVSASTMQNEFMALMDDGRVIAWHETYFLFWKRLSVPEELR